VPSIITITVMEIKWNLSNVFCNCCIHKLDCMYGLEAGACSLIVLYVLFVCMYVCTVHYGTAHVPSSPSVFVYLVEVFLLMVCNVALTLLSVFSHQFPRSLTSHMSRQSDIGTPSLCCCGASQ